MATQLQKDFDAFFQNTKPGEAVKVGDLTYTMGQGGRATVSGPGGYNQSFTSSTNPAALASNPVVKQTYQSNYGVTATPPPGRDQMQTDFNNALQRVNSGETIEADGFTYTLNQYGQPVVIAPSGKTTPLENRDFENLAWNNPEYAYSLNKNYGTDFDVRPITPSYWGNFAPQMQIGGVALKDMDQNNPARKRIDDLYRSIYGTSPLDPNAGYKAFDPNIAAGFEGVRAQYTDNPYLQQQSAGGTSTGALTGAPGGFGSSILPIAGQVLNQQQTQPGTGTGQTQWPGAPGSTGGATGGTGQTGAGGLLHQAQIGEVATYNPYTSEVDYNELVQNRMADALDTPYANLQRKRALDEMNERGLLNSSLATQAADRASLDAALPIAQQDAATMTENRFRANDSINQALETNTASRNQMTKANMDALNAFGLDAQQFAQQRDLTATEHAQQMRLAEFDAGMRERLTQMTLNSDEFIQQNSLNQQDREFVIKSAAANNEYIMGAVSQLQQMEGFTADQRATMMDELGGIHYANLQMLQQLTGVQIDWNSMGTGQAIVPPVDQNAETPVNPNPYRDTFLDESMYT